MATEKAGSWQHVRKRTLWQPGQGGRCWFGCQFNEKLMKASDKKPYFCKLFGIASLRFFF
jgi:hypothetical protein